MKITFDISYMIFMKYILRDRIEESLNNLMMKFQTVFIHKSEILCIQELLCN